MRTDQRSRLLPIRSRQMIEDGLGGSGPAISRRYQCDHPTPDALRCYDPGARGEHPTGSGLVADGQSLERQISKDVRTDLATLLAWVLVLQLSTAVLVGLPTCASAGIGTDLTGLNLCLYGDCEPDKDDPKK